MKRALLVLLSLALPSPDAAACAAIGVDGPVAIEGEEALLVWDAARGVEHFVRRAAFAGAPASFGFLVPTPTRPELAEVDEKVFARLFDLYRAPPETMRSRGFVDGRGIPAVASRPVEVVEQKRVAGMDASVLLASDGKALADWLQKNHYPSSPALEAWLRPYVARGSYVTAFKLAGDGGRASSGAVRMSFKTAAPFFPYAEPPSRAAGRPFRLSVVAPDKLSAQLGGKPWGAAIGFAAPVKHDELTALLDGVVPKDAVVRGAWLTVFDEPSSRRGVDDLVLVPAKDARKVAPTLHTKILP